MGLYRGLRVSLSNNGWWRGVGGEEWCGVERGGGDKKKKKKGKGVA